MSDATTLGSANVVVSEWHDVTDPESCARLCETRIGADAPLWLLVCNFWDGSYWDPALRGQCRLENELGGAFDVAGAWMGICGP